MFWLGVLVGASLILLAIALCALRLSGWADEEHERAVMGWYSNGFRR